MGEFTIRDLAAELRLGLRLLAPDGGDESASSARTRATSHPARYVLPGELVLTNGLWLDDVAPEVDLRGRRPARSASVRPEQRAPGRPGAGRGGVRGSELPLIKCPDDLFSLVWARPRAHHRRGERRAAPAGWTRRLSSGSRRQRPRGAARANRRRTGLTAAFVGGRADHRHGDGSPSRDGQARLFRGAAASFLARSPIGSASRRADAVPGLRAVVQAPMRDIPDGAAARQQVAAYGASRTALPRARTPHDDRRAHSARARRPGGRDRLRDARPSLGSIRSGRSRRSPDVPIELLHYAAEASGRPTRSRSSVVAAAPARGSRARAAGGDRRRGPRRRRASDGLRRLAVGARALRRSLVEASTALQPRARADNGSSCASARSLARHCSSCSSRTARRLPQRRARTAGRWTASTGARSSRRCGRSRAGGHWRGPPRTASTTTPCATASSAWRS